MTSSDEVGHKGTKSRIKTYRDLFVWKKAMVLVTEIYQTTKTFPKEELYGLVSQTQRSAVSIASNIAEGYGRNSKDDYLRFLQIALGSLYEIQTQVEIAFNLGYIQNEVFQGIFASSREIERMLSCLINKVRNK